MDISDFVTIAKFALLFCGVIYAHSTNWTHRGLTAGCLSVVLVAFIWGFEGFLPYDNDPWGQLIAEGLPGDLTTHGVMGGLLGIGVVAMIALFSFLLTWRGE